MGYEYATYIFGIRRILPKIAVMIVTIVKRVQRKTDGNPNRADDFLVVLSEYTKSRWPKSRLHKSSRSNFKCFLSLALMGWMNPSMGLEDWWSMSEDVRRKSCFIWSFSSVDNSGNLIESTPTRKGSLRLQCDLFMALRKEETVFDLKPAQSFWTSGVLTHVKLKFLALSICPQKGATIRKAYAPFDDDDELFSCWLEGSKTNQNKFLRAFARKKSSGIRKQLSSLLN